jgi:hypothetical protein
MRRFTVAGALLALLIAAALLGTAGCSEPEARVPEPEGIASEETTRVEIYFATGRSLVQEPRVVSVERVYEETLDEILAAQPEIVTDVAVVQPVAGYRSITLAEDGVLTIDWEREVLDFEAEPQEKRIALAGILYSFGRFPEVEKVRFTVEGQEDGQIDGRDVQDFWLDVSLIGQPWDVIRPQESGDGTSTVEPEPSDMEEPGSS